MRAARAAFDAAPRRSRDLRRRRSAVPAAVASVLLALLLGACGSGDGRSPSTAAAGTPAPGECNGSAALCARRIDQVYFPATHNSMGASEEPGWHFGNQHHGIQRQLADGVTGLLIDVHFGVQEAGSPVVRTDLRAEGSDRNKVAQTVPAQALALADRIGGRVGAPLVGEPKLYLCHTLCELGSEPLEAELEGIGRFLGAHPGTVLVVIVEDYVPPAAIAAAFAHAGLDRYVETLTGGAPLPTLGALTASGRRLLVFAEKDGGEPAWYMRAFEWIADTPLGALSPTQLSCARYRGTPESPLLLINHWIPPFPPSPTVNEQIGRSAYLRSRVRRCTRERGAHGAIIAVDFYDRTAAVAVARELNAQG